MPASQRSWEAPHAVCPTCGEPFWDPEVTHCPHDGAALVVGDGDSGTMMERVVGGRYRLLGLLGEGGMGTVYAAEHQESLRRVALKIIKPELESSAVARGRFLRECELLERIDSPYVVQVHESGQSEAGEVFLVMELLEGVSLGDRIETRGAVPPAEAVRIAVQIAHALGAAHHEGIVHRDLKPDNVFVCEDGTVRVLDFGIARLLDGVTLEPGSRKLTATGTIVGTPAYISPEGAAGGFIGPAADLYSLGVLLHEMLAGELPFWDSHPVLLMGKHLKEPPPRLSVQGLPNELVDLVEELLQKTPEARPASADEVRARLEAMRRPDGSLEVSALDTIAMDPASLEEITASAPTPTPLAVEPAPRPRASWLMLGVAGGLALLGLVGVAASLYLTAERGSAVEAADRGPEPGPIQELPVGADPPRAAAQPSVVDEPDATPGATDEASVEAAGTDGAPASEGEVAASESPGSDEEEAEPRAPREGPRSGRRRRAGRSAVTSPSSGRRRRARARGADDMVRDYW